jgi:hypothetical protein
MDIQINKFTPTIWSQFADDFMDEIFGEDRELKYDPEASALVVVVNNRPFAFVEYRLIERTVFLRSGGFFAQHGEKPIFKFRIIYNMVQYFKDQFGDTYEKIKTVVGSNNERLLRIYRKLGFQELKKDNNTLLEMEI